MTLAGRLLAEPARPAAIRNWPGAPWLAVGTVCVGAFMSQLDASIVTLALPRLRSDLGVSLAAAQWVSLSYLLVLVGTVTAIGRLADLAGRKLLYLYGFAIFTLGSVGCGLAGGLAVLLAMRVLQALGAALLQANSVALIRTTVAPAQLGRAIGIQGAAQALGLAAGPAVGGVLITAGGWRWVFWANLPVGLLGIGLGVLLLPRTRIRAERQRPDWAGMLSLLGTVALLLLGLSLLAGRPVLGAGLSLLAVIGLGAFCSIEGRVGSPMIDPSLLLTRSGAARARPNRLASGLAAGLLGYLVLFGTLMAAPLYLASVALRPVAAGLLVTVLPVSLALVTPLGALAADRFGAAAVSTAGLLSCSAGLAGTAGWLLVAHGSRGGTASIAAMLAVTGVGLGLFLPANNASIAGSGRPDQAGLISGLLNMTRGVGTALGVAITTACFALTAGSGSRSGLLASVLTFAVLASAAARLTGRRPGSATRSG